MDDRDGPPPAGKVDWQTGHKFITVSQNGKQLGSRAKCVATAGIEAVITEAVDSVMVGVMGVGVVASGANVGNGMLGLVEVGRCEMAAG
ncbi:TPA: hypothetical protein ACH3X1_006607 [Trebouxia sp. C0004]